jgi:hypothetical protein
LALVGDCISAFRLEAPDPPQSLPRPSAIVLSAVNAGPISAYGITAGGAGYAVGDTGKITTGTGDATYAVYSIGPGGAVTGVSVTNPGTAYTANPGQATATGGFQPGAGVGLTIAVAATTGIWPSGTTVFCVATALNQWGETTPTGEVSQLLNGGTRNLNAEITVGPGTTAIRLYFGTGAGLQNQYVEIPVAPTSVLGSSAGTYLINIPIPNPASASPGTPPVQNNAWLPDTDGSAISAAQLYGWLNDGLTELTELAGGILDSTGMQGMTENMYYIVPGKWYEITEIRWQNWPGFAAKRNEIFYRIILSGVPTLFTEEGRAGRQIIGSWPAPGASGNQTQLLGGAGGLGTPLQKDDTSMIVANALNFTVQQRLLIEKEVILFGQIDQNPNGTYTISGLIRNVGLTRPAQHLPGVAVTELQITVVGYRYPCPYMVGDSAQPLDIPPGWETPIRQYMRYRYLSLEQGDQDAASVYEEFKKHGNQLRIQRMGAVRSLQVGPPLLSEDPAGAWEGRILVP